MPPRKKNVATPDAADAKNSLLLARSALDRVFKEDDVFVDIDEDRLKQSLPHISSGSVIIDFLIGGTPNRYGVQPCPGFPRGRLVNLYGHESSGKTTLCLMAAAAVIRAGGKVCYIDWEHAIDIAYSEALGVPMRDKSKFMLAQPQTLEKGLSIVWAMCKAGVDLVVVDSVGSCVPQAVFEQTIGEQGQQARVGAIAAAWSQFLPKLRGVITHSQSCVIGISQLRDAINTGGGGYGGEKSIQQGGRAWKFNSDVRLSLRKFQQEKGKAYDAMTHSKIDTVTGVIAMAKIDKCRVAASQGKEAKFYIKFGEGIDDIRSIIEVASNHNLVSKAGAWYNWDQANGNTIRGCGMDAFKAEVKKTPGAWEELYKATLSAAVVTGDAIDEEEVEEDLDLTAILNGVQEPAPVAEDGE